MARNLERERAIARARERIDPFSIQPVAPKSQYRPSVEEKPVIGFNAFMPNLAPSMDVSIPVVFAQPASFFEWGGGVARLPTLDIPVQSRNVSTSARATSSSTANKAVVVGGMKPPVPPPKLKPAFLPTSRKRQPYIFQV